ncbi:MAG: FKBP-type peptidyl-prolyl cis-trans isomerase [Pseudomonadales bacterium]|nr:FKBP-type peptidyl-prolyl cis-trans isomerase [Pseudomonadales bacterium]
MSDKYSTTEQQVSYGIGRQLGDQLNSNPFDGMSIEAVIEGVSDSLNHAANPIEPAVLDAAFKEISAHMQAQKTEKTMELAGEGEKFLAENAKRSEITVTESGLQYEIINAGDGEKPTASSTVRTHYHGTLITGKVFDSSYDRGDPAEFPVGGVIAGWTEALQMMEVGAKWKLYLPYQLAYGENGAGGDIGPYSALIFDVELLAIVG